MTLKTRLILAFSSLVLLLGGVTLIVGSRLIAKAVVREAQYRTVLDLRSVRAHLDNRLEGVQAAVESTARRLIVTDFLQKKASRTQARVILEKERINFGLDVLTFCDSEGNAVLRTRHPYNAGGNRATDALVERALKGKASRGITVLYEDDMRLEGGDLASQAFINVVDTPHAKPRPEKTESSGLFLWAAAPVEDANGKIVGAFYGGMLLNRNWAVVDEIRDVVYGQEKDDGREVGTVTLFLRDVRIATNVRDEKGNRAVGTRVSAEVYDRVFENGLPWQSRAFVVKDWYLSAYEPIRDTRDQIVGILYTGILESKYTQLKNMILRSFISPLVVALVLALLLSLVLGRMVTAPVFALSAAAERIAKGDFKHRLPQSRSVPELEKLEDTFRGMSEAIDQRDKELRRKNDALVDSNDKLRQLNQNYLEMLEFISHELKNPLNSMIFGTMSLKDGYLGTLNEQQKKALETILKNTEYLEEMVVHYLNLSRIEKGELEIKKHSVDFVRDVLDPAILQTKPQIDAAKMKIDIQTKPGIAFLADAGLLRLVMENLLSNAAKYGREGGRVEVQATRGPDEVKVSVWNEGDGIAHQDLDKLFGKFVRLAEPSGTARKGTGLGLFICRQIIEKHNGRIWAESGLGQGARFTWSVPV